MLQEIDCDKEKVESSVAGYIALHRIAQRGSREQHARVIWRDRQRGRAARGAQSCAVDHSASHKVKEND